MIAWMDGCLQFTAKPFYVSPLMRVHVLSDLHLEFAAFQPSVRDADLVVLAGDIHTLTKGVEWANDTFSVPVLYVVGNHEFYKGHFDRTLQKIRAAAAPHVFVLENQSFVMGKIRFLGATCWTDFTATGDISAAMSLARENMNDFRLIRADSSYRRLRPDDVAARNRQTKAWLTDELGRPHDGLTVVISHHAPVIEVQGDNLEGHLTASYFNNWHALVEEVDLWIFGHTHMAIDLSLGGCRMVSNPRGYPGELTGFDPQKVLYI